MSATFSVCICGHLGHQHVVGDEDSGHKDRLLCSVDKCYCLGFVEPANGLAEQAILKLENERLKDQIEGSSRAHAWKELHDRYAALKVKNNALQQEVSTLRLLMVQSIIQREASLQHEKDVLESLKSGTCTDP